MYVNKYTQVSQLWRKLKCASTKTTAKLHITTPIYPTCNYILDVEPALVRVQKRFVCVRVGMGQYSILSLKGNTQLGNTGIVRT